MSMLFSNAYLKQCDSLLQKGMSCSFRSGNLVGRGFADYGFELYSVLPDGRLLSLMTGESLLPAEGDKSHFFQVFSVDELFHEIDRLGFDFKQASRDGWEWTTVFSKDSGEVLIEKKADSLLIALAHSLEEVLDHV